MINFYNKGPIKLGQNEERNKFTKGTIQKDEPHLVSPLHKVSFKDVILYLLGAEAQQALLSFDQT